MLTTKKCRICETTKDISEFGKHSYTFDGIRADCKLCARQACINYKRSKDGIVSKIYANQLRSARQREMELPTYSKEELREWLYSQKKFHLLYDNYKRLNYQKDYVPSVDRKDDYISYTMSNIQLLTWKQHNEKTWDDMRTGKNRKQCVPIVQMTLDGDFIAEHYSAKSVEKTLNIGHQNIVACCRGRRNIAGGFAWKYKE